MSHEGEEEVVPLAALVVVQKVGEPPPWTLRLEQETAQERRELIAERAETVLALICTATWS